MALALAGLGEVAASHGAPRRAGRLLGAGQALLPASDPLLHVIVPYDLSTQLAAARARDDPAAFDRGLSEGQAWNIDRAVAAGPATRLGQRQPWPPVGARLSGRYPLAGPDYQPWRMRIPPGKT
jgi:hypothetical protein